MNSPLTYLPVYLGLLATQILALVCNTFLDIQFGIFGTEVLLWSIAYAFTMRLAWRQGGSASEDGKRWTRRVLVAAILLSLLIFLPMWGLPRGVLYMLAALQVAYNCMTTSRGHLHLSLSISVAMVLFAASHYRADWTMLFYLIPFVAAAVFTLVAEQINRKASELREQSLGRQVVGAQGAAIGAATSTILVLGLLLYVLTPQPTWLSLSSDWGQPSSIPGGNAGSQGGGVGVVPEGSGGGGANEGGGGHMTSGWLSSAEMRQAAARPGMPEWQSGAINSMADVAESLRDVMEPVMRSMEDLWKALKKWLKEHRNAVANLLFALAALALLYALWRLMREARAATWLRTRFDYFRLVRLGRVSGDEHGARNCYEAMERLFLLQDIERGKHANTLEYQNEIGGLYRHLRGETGEMTRLYEDARFGGMTGGAQVSRMRELYGRIFRQLA